MELGDYLGVLRWRWAPVSFTVSFVAAAGLLHQQTRDTQAMARLVPPAPLRRRRAPRASSSVELATTYAQFAPTAPVIDAALAAAGGAPAAGRPEVTAVAEPSAPFPTVTVADTDPEAAVANAYTTPLPGAVARLEGRKAGTVTDLTVLTPAAVPAEPARPKPTRNGAIGLALGLMLGAGSAFLRALDRSYKHAEQLEEETGLSMLGVVPQELSEIALPTLTKPTSNRAAAYRNIRTHVQFAGPSHSLKTILITSATACDGQDVRRHQSRSAFAVTGQCVVPIDADLRHARRRAALGAAGAAGGAAGRFHARQPQRAARQPRNGAAARGAGRAVRGRAGRQSAGAAGDRALVLAVNAAGVEVVVRLERPAASRCGGRSGARRSWQCRCWGWRLRGRRRAMRRTGTGTRLVTPRSGDETRRPETVIGAEPRSGRTGGPGSGRYHTPSTQGAGSGATSSLPTT